MPTKVSYSGIACAGGVLVPFSGVNLALNQNYNVSFSCISQMPSGSFSVVPTGFNFAPSQESSTLVALFKTQNSFTLQNSSSNIIKLSIFNNNGTEVYRDYAAVNCGNLSVDPIQANPTPTPTPTNTVTPTITPTPTLTPTPTITPSVSARPPITFRPSFENYVTTLPDCGKAVIRAQASGIIGRNYTYSFSSDMQEVDLNISNQSGTVTISSNPTYVYTSVFLLRPCDKYSIKFGLSDGQYTLESLGFLKCGNC